MTVIGGVTPFSLSPSMALIEVSPPRCFILRSVVLDPDRWRDIAFPGNC